MKSQFAQVAIVFSLLGGGGAARADARTTRAYAADTLVVAVIGAGIAGESATHHLAERFGIRATVYEASTRAGGPIYSSPNAFGLGIQINDGPALVDSHQTDFIHFAEAMGAKIVPRYSTAQRPVGYLLLNGQILSESAFQQKLWDHNAAALERFYQDSTRLGDTAMSAGGRLTEFERELDAQNGRQYLLKLGFDQLALDFFAAGMTSEMSRRLEEVSSLVVHENFGANLRERKLEFLHHHDESLVVEGGTQRVVDGWLRRYGSQVHFQERLTEIEELENKKLRLTFESPRRNHQVVVDSVILTIPPPALNQIRWRMKGGAIPPQMVAADAQTAGNSKLALLFKRNLWGETPLMGMTRSGVGYQAWNTPARAPYAVMTLYTEPLRTRGHDPKAIVDEFLNDVERAFPGIREAYSGQIHESEFPYSYSSGDRPFDRTFRRIPGLEFRGVTFAGQAWSRSSQAYINGAVETGRAAATEIGRKAIAIQARKKTSHLFPGVAAAGSCVWLFRQLP